MRVSAAVGLLVLVGALGGAYAQSAAKPDAPRPLDPHAAALLAGYGPYRANNHLLFYHLDVRVNPAAKTIRGKNTIRFRMLQDGSRLQIDLAAEMAVEKIVLLGGWRHRELKYTRDGDSVFIDFPQTLQAGRDYAIDFYYSGTPLTFGRFGCFSFDHDPAGRPWVTTACEGDGPRHWWPNKDQWRDRPESMEISVTAPDGLMDVSNGRLVGHHRAGHGYTRWDWRVSYPINNYDVVINVGDYVHLSGGRVAGTTVDYYVLPEDVGAAQRQFAQVPEMLRAFTHYFGPYPFARDGYKLVQAPYAGMEHQSAIAYGNGFTNGYLGKDWTGVGISPRFDFILVHESAHEWFGNSVTAADKADMWIHEGWATYMEGLYVEYRWGHADALRYLNGLKEKIENKQPILGVRGSGVEPSEDQYFKGALLLNTLRSVIGDDAKWFAMIRGFYQAFAYKTILTEDAIAYFNQQSGKNLTPIFNAYLKHAAIPMLELRLHHDASGLVDYRWKVDEPGFAMPVEVGAPGHWQRITPTEQWQTMPAQLAPDAFQVETQLYYVDVSRL